MGCRRPIRGRAASAPGRGRAGSGRAHGGAHFTPRWLVIGLGNPGPRYQRTRHNAGFAVLALLAQRQGGHFRHSWLGARGETARVDLRGAEATLLRPLTFMNLSGEAVRPLLKSPGRRDGYTPAELILVYDDMDVPLGRLRLRLDGRPGGHRGVASVLAAVGSEGVARIRVGIGRPREGQDAAEYVLSEIPPREGPVWEASLARAADAVEEACGLGFEAAMARFNRADPA